MPKPNTVIIPSWMSAPCGGCGRRKGENEIKALRKNVGSGGEDVNLWVREGRRTSRLKKEIKDAFNS